jgi:spermidine synthase
MVDRMDRRMSAICRGGDMKTMSRGGADNAGASLQDDETDILTEADCELLTETLNAKITRLVIREVFDTDECLAEIVINPEISTDTKREMEVDTFRQILAAFREAFPTAVAVLASNSLDTPVIGLLARPDEPLPGPQAVAARHRAAHLAYGDLLERARLVDEYAVLGALFSGPAGLQAAAADAPVNRDDRPVVAHAAAWDTYAPQRPPRERLAALLDAATPWPDLAAAPIAWEDPAQAAAMAAYWQARSRYLALGMALPPGLPPPEILTRLAAPLGALLADSPRFTPAADTLAALRAAAARAPHSSAP